MEGLEHVALFDDHKSLDHYPRILRRVLGVPISVVSIVEQGRQVFASALGLSEPDTTSQETSLSHPFCKNVVRDGLPFIVCDARADARVAGHPAITELDVVAYAGWPLHTESGRTIGSLCAMDSKPRTWTDDDLALLADLAHACSAELNHSERHAVATENLARAIFDTVDVAMAFYGADDRLILANDFAWRAADVAGFALDVSPYAGDEVRAADNKTSVPYQEQLIPRALRGEHVRSAMNWVGTLGRQIALNGSSCTVLHADGTRWGTLIAAHDVTRLARELQLKDNFIGTVAHELRTPLSSIIGSLELIAGELKVEPGPLADAMSIIDRNTQNLQTRIDELVNTAERRRTLELRSTDVAGLVQGVAHSFEEQAEIADVMLTVNVDDDTHWADIDPRRVKRAIENLVSNALKFTPPAGHIGLAVSSTPEGVQIVVADTGSGMTADDVTQACDMFWRAESTHHSATQGLGIGLTFVRDTVEMHGGAINIDSHPGRGTTFTLTFARDACGPLQPATARHEFP